MRRTFAALGIAVGLVVTSASLRPSVALACSAGPDFDAVRDSELIVAGRITGWELGAPRVIPPPPGNLADVPLRITLRVDRVYKGPAAHEITFLDSGSLLAADQARSRYPDLNVGVGGCSVFETSADPVGRYVVLGFTREDGETITANRLLAFFVGDAPEGPNYDQAVARLASRGAARLPATGTGMGAPRPRTEALPIGIAVLGGLISATAACRRWSTRRR